MSTNTPQNYRTIFCDEAGFTGNHLLDKTQPFFVYTAIPIEPSEAKDIVSTIKQKYRFQGDELKSTNLLKYSQGRKAIIEILEQIIGRAKVVAHDKKYALAANIFEYTFELCLAQNNAIFYKNNFHKFISVLLYVHFKAQDEDAQQIFEHFQSFMKPGNSEQIANLLKKKSTASNLVIFNNHSVLDSISVFLELNKDKIQSELAHHTMDSPLHRWILDLTNTSLFSLLGTIGQDMLPMEVYCDQSKPLSQHREIFDVMVGRKEQAFSELLGKRKGLVFNLVKPLSTVCSKEHPGIQLADVVSGAVLYTLKNPQDDLAKNIFRLLLENHTILDESVFPDMDHVDLNSNECSVNALILLELVNRSIHQKSLLDGMGEYYELCHTMVLQKQPPWMK